MTCSRVGHRDHPSSHKGFRKSVPPSVTAPTAASVLTLIQAIDRIDPDAPAAIAFGTALRRKGIQADAAGGLQALEDLIHAVVEADGDRADARTAIIRDAWRDVLGAGL